jgi:hypothetical protein
MKPIKTTLKIYWEDGATIEQRYFPSIRSTKQYVKDNGIDNYQIEEHR